MDLNLVQLRAFVAVAEALHFGRAAARLHVTQPALSQQISKLEQRLGLQLLTRTSRSVALTPAGAELLEDARRVLAAADATLDTARALHASPDQTLAIGFTGSAASRLLPAVLARYRSRRPQVRVSLRELTGERYDLLREGAIDAVFGRLQPDEMPDLEVVVLDRSARVAALPAGHRLAARTAVRMQELAPDGFITQPEALNPGHRRRWLAEQRAHGLPGRIVAEASSVQEFLNLVAAGEGVCVVPAEAREFNPWPGVVYVPVDDAEPTTTSLATRRGEDRVVAPLVTAARELSAAAAGPGGLARSSAG